jgi:O-antigen ligase
VLAKLKHIYLNFGYNLPLIIALFLPFGINYSPIILMWLVAFFVFQDFKHDFALVFKNKWALIFFSFFLVHFIGYFFSDNKSEAITAIEIKLSFLAFPILFYSSKYNSEQVKKIIISFVTGTFLASLLCLLRAFYLYLFEDKNSFFYSEFSFFLHPSYFAMYLVFSLLLVVIYYPKWLLHLPNLKFKLVFISLVFLITIFLCSSKMGLITAFFLIPSTLGVLLFKNGYKKTIIGFILILIFGILISYKLFPTPFERIKVAFKVSASSEKIDKTDAESTAVRILIWQESIKIIKDNFLFGTTAGDANDKLIESYQKEGLTGALIKKLNAHNQFFQTFIGTGIIGFILLMLFTLGAFICGIFKKNFMLSLLSILMIFNFLVESMLQAQAGFIFFMFFFCLITQYNFNFLNKHS